MDLSTREGRREQGALIQAAAEESGLSLEQLAREIGCSRALIYQYVSGAVLAQPDRVQKIAARTGKPLAFFYSKSTPATERLETERRELEQLRLQLEKERAELHARQLMTSLRNLYEVAEAQNSPPDFKALCSTCERIVPLARAVGDRAAEGRALWRLGNARLQLGELPAALAVLEQALGLLENEASPTELLSLRQSLGNALLSLGDPERAIAEFEQVAAGQSWVNRWQGALSLGAMHEQLGEYGRALADLDRAAAALEEGDNPRAVALGRLYHKANLVNVHTGCGDYRLALRLSRECLAEADRLGNRDQQIEARLNIGHCLHYLGEWPEAHETLSWAAESSEFLEDRAREAAAQACLCSLLSEMGDFEAAKESGKEALRLAIETAASRAELLAHSGLAEAYLRTGSLRESLYHTEQGLRVAERLKVRRHVAYLTALRGEVAVSGGNDSEGARDLEQAMGTADAMGARHVHGYALAALAQPCRITDPARAIGLAQQAAEMGREMDTPVLVSTALGVMADSLSVSGDTANALSAAREAVAILESLRQRLREAEMPDTMLEHERHQGAYVRAAVLIARESGEGEARQFLEAADWPPLLTRFEKALAGGEC